MKKEGIIAIIIGLSIGLIIAFGLHTANQALKKAKPVSLEPIPSLNPLPEGAINLIINEPENNIVTSSLTATVSGQTDPNTPIAIFTEGQEDIILSDEDGLFSKIISLIPGLNEIKIMAINKSGQQKEIWLQIIQSKAEIE